MLSGKIISEMEIDNTAKTFCWYRYHIESSSYTIEYVWDPDHRQLL